MRIRDATAVAKRRGADEDELLSAERPILKLKNPLARATAAKPRVGGKVHAIHKNPPSNEALSLEEQEVAKYFNNMSTLLEIPMPKVHLGDNSATVDDSVLLDLALAHGNPISRYIRTRKEGDWTRSDYVILSKEEKPVLAPERVRRVVVGAKPDGNWVWGLLPDCLIETRTTYLDRKCILRWVPGKFRDQMPNRETMRQRQHIIRRFPNEQVEANEIFKVDPTRHTVIACDTRTVAGYYGESNIADEREELLRIAGVKNPSYGNSFPQRLCTWIRGEDTEKLKKKSSRKTFASANHRRDNNRTSWAFPSVGTYRPPPKRWRFFRNTDGMSRVYNDELPWPNGIFDAQRNNEEHNRRAAEWMNNAKYFFERWLFAAQGTTPNLDPKDEKEEVPVMGVVPEVVQEESLVDAVLEPEDPEDFGDLTAAELLKIETSQFEEQQAATMKAVRKGKSRRKKKANARLSRRERKRAQRAERKAKDIDRVLNSSPLRVEEEREVQKPQESISPPVPKERALERALASAREDAGKHSVLEGEYIPASEQEESLIAFVRSDGLAALMEGRNLGRWALEKKLIAFSQVPAKGNKLEAVKPTKESPVSVVPFRVHMSNSFGEFDLDLSDPGVFKQIDWMFTHAEGRIEELSLWEDVLEDLEEEALRRQDLLRPEEMYVAYRTRHGVFGQAAIDMAKYEYRAKHQPKVRKMTMGDLGIKREPSPIHKNFRAYIRKADAITSCWKKHRAGLTRREQIKQKVESEVWRRMISTKAKDVRWVAGMLELEARNEREKHIHESVQIRIRQRGLERKVLMDKAHRNRKKVEMAKRAKQKERQLYEQQFNSQLFAARRLFQKFDQLYNKGGLEKRKQREKKRLLASVNQKITAKQAEQDEVLALERRLLKAKRKKEYNSLGTSAIRQTRRAGRKILASWKDLKDVVSEQILAPPKKEVQGVVEKATNGPAKVEPIVETPIVRDVTPLPSYPEILKPKRAVKIDGVMFGETTSGILIPERKVITEVPKEVSLKTARMNRKDRRTRRKR